MNMAYLTSADHPSPQSGESTVARNPDTPRESSPKPVVTFHLVSDFPGWEKAPEWILSIITAHGIRNVLEVGCGANPTLSSEVVSALNVHYTVNDVSAEELDKADKVFDRWVCDLAKDEIPPEMRGRFDLIFSRMVNEHVSDGQAYHTKIRSLLKPGGLAAHCFSTLYSLPFLINKLLPGSVSDFLLRIFRPRDLHKLGKFRAYYSWSRGPSPAILSQFDALGYEVDEYKGYFGHTYYIRLPLLHWLEGLKARMLVARPIPALCSYSMLIARKR
jgi:SAM-dependent methyltransferase